MPALIPVDNTLGAAFIGHILSSVVFGVTCLQVYEYYMTNSSGDTKLLKLFVAAIMALDLLHLLLVSHTVYFFLVTNFGDYERLARIIWSIEVQVGVADVITCLIQGFFALRIYELSGRKNWWLPSLIVLCGLGLVAAAIGFMVTAFADELWVSQTKYAVPWTIGGATASLIGDTLMTAGLSYYLLRARTGFDSTNRAITLLVTYALNTGLLTTIFSALTLAVFVTKFETLLYTPFFFVLARLYSCAFMSTLNGRKRVRDAMAARRAEDSYVLPNFGSRVTDSHHASRGAEVYFSAIGDDKK